jgi:ATP-binding cassette subfamily F protein uup
LFAQPANVLVMDEPTNDLDAETLDLLETLLVEFTGTLLLVSHDRAFLNNVVSSTLVFEVDETKQSNVREYVGGYDDWLRQRPVLESITPKSEKKAASAPPKTRKLSWKEARELETLPLQIEKMEARQAEIGAMMAQPAFYQSDPAAATRAMAELKQIESDLARDYARWDELLEKEKETGNAGE